MWLLGRVTLWLVVLAGLAVNAGAQGLGDAAQREKERRAKVKAEQPPAKTYDEEGLRKATGSTYNQVEGPPLTTSMTSTSRASRSAPTIASADQPADSVSQLEQRVRELEKRRATLPPGPFGPSGAGCQAGVEVRPGEIGSSIELRDRSRKTKVCDPEVLHQQEAQRVQAELDQARAALARARPR